MEWKRGGAKGVIRNLKQWKDDCSNSVLEHIDVDKSDLNFIVKELEKKASKEGEMRLKK